MKHKRAIRIKIISDKFSLGEEERQFFLGQKKKDRVSSSRVFIEFEI